MTEEKEKGLNSESTTIDVNEYRKTLPGNETPQEGEGVSEEVRAMYNDMLNLLANCLTMFTKLTNIKLSSGTILCNSRKQSDSDKYDFSYQINGSFEPLEKL